MNTIYPGSARSLKIAYFQQELNLLPIGVFRGSGVCKKWKIGVEQSMGRRRSLSFDRWKMDDDSLRELDISRTRWECQISDGLIKISMAKCIPNLINMSLWGMAGIPDHGVIQLISRAASLQHLNIGGTFITDESLYAIAHHCPNLKSIVLWSCRQITESGLLVLVTQCRQLKAINLWGTRDSDSCFTELHAISPALPYQASYKPGSPPIAASWIKLDLLPHSSFPPSCFMI